MNDLLKFINEKIEEEHGEPIGMDDAIATSGVDSFGLTMVLMEVNDFYGIWTKKTFGGIDFPNITPRNIQGLIDENK